MKARCERMASKEAFSIVGSGEACENDPAYDQHETDRKSPLPLAVAESGAVWRGVNSSSFGFHLGTITRIRARISTATRGCFHQTSGIAAERRSMTSLWRRGQTGIIKIRQFGRWRRNSRVQPGQTIRGHRVWQAIHLDQRGIRRLGCFCIRCDRDSINCLMTSNLDFEMGYHSESGCRCDVGLQVKWLPIRQRLSL